MRGPRARRSTEAATPGRTIYFAASTLVNISSFLFHVVYSRNLGPTSYSALGALLALIVVVAIPLGALQLSYAQAQVRAPSGASVRRLLATLTGIGVAIFAASLALAPAFEGYLHLHSLAPLVLLSAYLLVATVSVLPLGILLGQQRFRELAVVTLAGGGVGRIALSILFSGMGLGVNGALSATLLGQLVTLAWGLARIRTQLVGQAAESVRVTAHEGLLSLASLIGLAMIGSIDTVLSRHVLSAQTSSYYVIADTTGRVALFAPSALAVIFFPRFTRAVLDGRDARRLLGMPYLLIGAMGGAYCCVTALAPRLILRTLYGQAYSPASAVLPLLSVAGALLGCLTLLTYFHLARHGTAALIPWATTVSVAVIVSVTATDSHRLAVIMVVLLAISTALSTGTALLPRHSRQAAASEHVSGTAVSVPRVSEAMT